MSGLRIPPLLYGTAWKKDRTESLVATALRAGFRGIDTACQPKHYDEPAVGRGIAASGLARADLFVQTKYTPVGGQDPSRIPYDPAAPLAAQVEQSCAVSLHNLQTSYLDCLVLHSPLDAFSETLTVWRAMESLHDAGHARALGISNCYGLKYLVALHDAARIKPAVVQNRFYAATGYDREIRSFCASHGAAYQSFWTLSANPQLLADPVISDLARKHGRTPAQILFRYLTLEGVVPLTGTTSEAHMRDGLQIFQFVLSADERREVTGLLGR